MKQDLQLMKLRGLRLFCLEHANFINWLYRFISFFWLS